MSILGYKQVLTAAISVAAYYEELNIAKTCWEQSIIDNTENPILFQDALDYITDNMYNLID